MEPDPIIISNASSSLIATTSPLPQVGGFDIFARLSAAFGGNGFSGAGFFEFLSSLWTTIAVIAYIFSILFLVIYIFASIRRNLYLGLMTQAIRDNEKLYAELYGAQAEKSRLGDVYMHAASNNPNDWKSAIIEADIILDETLKQRGYVGSTLAERLKTVSADQLESIGDAWEAHRVRNKIAHAGADFVLTKRLADDTILRYKRVFTEFGVS